MRLDYTDEELSVMSDEQLESVIHWADAKERSYNVEQMARKVLINSLYGALGNAYFRHYDLRNAEAITLSGQLSIRWIERKLNEYFNQMCGTKDYPYCVYIDTDSVVGDTLINVNGQDVKIEDYFNSLNTDYVVNTGREFVRPVDGDTALSMSKDLKVESKPIKYAMRHTVKKRMFKLTIGDKSVEVTEDHGLMVIRDGELIEVKPTEVINGDKMVRLESLLDFIVTEDFVIEDLGIKEITVYDIEVEDNHNFFANDILVHNSVYLRLDKFVEIMLQRAGKTEEEVGKTKLVDMLDKFAVTKVEPFIGESYQELAEYMNAFDQKMFMDREVIADCITGDMMVTTDNGTKRMDCIEVGDTVLTYNTHTKEQEFKNVVAFIDKGIQDVYEVELDDGRILRGTADHKVGCERDGIFVWVNLINLKDTDKVL